MPAILWSDMEIELSDIKRLKINTKNGKITGFENIEAIPEKKEQYPVVGGYDEIAEAMDNLPSITPPIADIFKEMAPGEQVVIPEAIHPTCSRPEWMKQNPKTIADLIKQKDVIKSPTVISDTPTPEKVTPGAPTSQGKISEKEEDSFEKFVTNFKTITDRVKDEILNYLRDNGSSRIICSINPSASKKDTEILLKNMLSLFKCSPYILKKALAQLREEKKIQRKRDEGGYIYSLNQCLRCGGELELKNSKYEDSFEFRDHFNFLSCIKCGEEYYPKEQNYGNIGRTVPGNVKQRKTKAA